ncbi:MAG: histidine kinase N-terminal domain-containing protein [Thermoleophilia bacterium]
MHLVNVADNLQLVADLGYGDTALAVLGADGLLTVVADARPSTAADPIAASRAGRLLTREAEPEAYAALEGARRVEGPSRHVGGFHSIAEAFPIGAPEPVAVVVRTFGEHTISTPSRMERAFIDSARDLLDSLRPGPLLDVPSGAPFATTRSAGDGVLRVSRRGQITYASPNAVTILRLAGVEGRVTGMRASELPGGGLGISPLLGAAGAMTTEMEVAGRVLSYRTMALTGDALVLVEDLTEARRRETELEIKEATIREVHHRVKNNLQTIASLLRIQARRSDNPEVRRALTEATERASAMATVHDLLTRSERERIDFAEAARRVVDLVRSGVVGDDSRITVSLTGTTGQIDASTATSLALTLAELVHNALEHAYAPDERGTVRVALRRDAEALVLTVGDDGRGLGDDFDPQQSQGLGFSIMRTLIEEDLRGSLTVTSAGGTCVTVRVPIGEAAP